MAKAELTLPGGTTVSINGSPDEITKILASLGAAATGTPRPPQVPRQRTSKGKRTASARPRAATHGPTAVILELRGDDFFKAKRSLNDIKKKLEERGHIYARTSLSPTLVKLVRRHDLRRVKDGTRWAYVY